MLEKRINWLSIIGTLATMIGLLGTVIGLVEAFYQIEQQEVRCSQEILLRESGQPY